MNDIWQKSLVFHPKQIFYCTIEFSRNSLWTMILWTSLLLFFDWFHSTVGWWLFKKYLCHWNRRCSNLNSVQLYWKRVAMVLRLFRLHWQCLSFPLETGCGHFPPDNGPIWTVTRINSFQMSLVEQCVLFLPQFWRILYISSKQMYRCLASFCI